MSIRQDHKRTFEGFERHTHTHFHTQTHTHRLFLLAAQDGFMESSEFSKRKRTLRRGTQTQNISIHAETTSWPNNTFNTLNSFTFTRTRTRALTIFRIHWRYWDIGHWEDQQKSGNTSHTALFRNNSKRAKGRHVDYVVHFTGSGCSLEAAWTIRGTCNHEKKKPGKNPQIPST